MDGYLAPKEDDSYPSVSTEIKLDAAQTIQKIPKRILQNAAGIAIFTCMRNGLWMTGSGGSGILIARKSDGTWSHPSGIMLHTPTLSFVMGVDIYDCVLVVNNLAALESVTRPQVTLGEEVLLVNGPLVSVSEDELRRSWNDLGNAVLAYMKARGQHQTVNLSGCILAERANENERFYGSNVSQMDILSGNVYREIDETKPLFEVIKMAEGRTDYDRTVIEKTAVQPAPGDAVIETPRVTPVSSRSTSFGIPQVDDPDPYGLLALEMAGLEIREAGSQIRPASSQFDFGFGPKSPNASKYSRQSLDTFASKSNRGSFMSSRTIKSQMTEAGVHTHSRNTPATSLSPRRSGEDGLFSPTDKDTEARTTPDIDYTTVDMTSLRHISQEYATTKPPIIEEEENDEQRDEEVVVGMAVGEPQEAAAASNTATILISEPSASDLDTAATESKLDDNADHQLKGAAVDDAEEEEEGEDADDEDDDEEPVVFEVAAVQPARTQAVVSRVIHARGNVVTIPKRIPPPLPERSPARASRIMKGEDAVDFRDLKSPLRQVFSEADVAEDAEDVENTDNAGDVEDAETAEVIETVEVTEPAEVTETVQHDSIAEPVIEPVPSSSPATTENLDDKSNRDTITLDNAPILARLVSQPTPTIEKVLDASEVEQVQDTTKDEDPKNTLMKETEEEAIKIDNQVSKESADKGSPMEEPKDHITTPLPMLAVAEMYEDDAESVYEEEQPDLVTIPDTLVTEIATEVPAVFAEIPERSQARLSSVATKNALVINTDISKRSSVESFALATSVVGKALAGEDDEDEAEPVETAAAETTDNGALLELNDTEDYDTSHSEDTDPVEPALSTANTDEADEIKEEESLPSTPQNESAEHSDTASNQKHTSSIFTGVTDDRWSCQGSSLTTPTSDRPGSIADDLIEDGTPKKPAVLETKSTQAKEEVHSVTRESGDMTPTTTVVVA